jgi:hypothetical protein
MTHRFSGNHGGGSTASRRGRAGRQRRFRHLCIEPLEPRRVLNGSGLDDYGQVAPFWFETVRNVFVGQDARGSGLLSGAAESGAAAPWQTGTWKRWIVRLTEDAARQTQSLQQAEQFLDRALADFQVIRGLGLPGQLLVRSFNSSDVARRSLDNNPHVAYFEADASVRAQALPDDLRFPEMWNLHNTGQSGGRARADMGTVAAWDLTTGSSRVVVGVIDSGVDVTHPDLYANIWINQREIRPELRSALVDVDDDGLFTFRDLNDPANAALVQDANLNGYIDAEDLLADPRWADGRDTDGNGFVDDLFGWDFRNHDNLPADDFRHGTHVAGIIAAQGNNGLGVTGVNWTSSLMVLKFLDETNSGDLSDAIAALNYVTMMRTQFAANVRVTNNSWGYLGESSVNLRAAIKASGSAEILFVAAAGNGDILNRGLDNDHEPLRAFYPASEDLDHVVSVAATDANDRLASFSNFGLQRVHIGAPGVGILSTEPNGLYTLRNGTSMAAPHVSGTAALIWSLVPEATVQEVREAILFSGDPIAALQGKLASGGRLNAYNALMLDTVAPRATLAAAADISGPGVTEQLIEVVYTDNRGFDENSLDEFDLVVTRRWDGYPLPGLTLESVDVQEHGRRCVAVYRLPAPDGVWGTADYGDYEIALRADQVHDSSYNSAAASVLGTFHVDSTEGLFRVDSLADAADGAPGDGKADDGLGRTTLRAAVMESNALPLDNLIRLLPDTYRLSLVGAAEDASVGDLDVRGRLLIRGAGAGQTILDAAGLHRVFHVRDGAHLELTDLTITGGTDDPGGAIYVAPGGALVLSGVEISGSVSRSWGGAIFNAGDLSITASTLSENTAERTGGAIHNAGTAVVVNSTISGNHAAGTGGSGGAVFNAEGATLTLLNSTVASNRARTTGGGIHNEGVTQMRNTIVAANAAAVDPDVSGFVDSQGYNLIENPSGGRASNVAAVTVEIGSGPSNPWSLAGSGASLDGAMQLAGDEPQQGGGLGSDFEGFETGDFGKFAWNRSGAALWTITSTNPHGGTYAARSGAITHNQQTTLSLTLETTAGNIRFARRVSSESGWDFLRFYINGNLQGSWSGEQAWAQQSYSVAAGTNTFTWTYQKDGSVSQGADAAWIDELVFPVLVEAPNIDVRGNGQSISDGDSTPSPLDGTDFGQAILSGATIVRQFTIENTGSQTLHLTGDNPITITGAHAADFTITAQPSLLALAAGVSTTFDVAFAPSALGPRNAAVNIASNDPDENPFDFGIQGQGRTAGGTSNIWIGLGPGLANEPSAQRFTGAGSPVQVIGNQFATHGIGYNLAASGARLYSGNGISVHQWDGISGTYLGPLSLSRPLGAEIGDWLKGIGTTTDGHLLFSAFGYSTDPRRLAKYTPTGAHVRTYAHSYLQHVQGTAAGNNDAVFVASRYNPGTGWEENVLMFQATGSFVGTIQIAGDVGDVAIQGNLLYVLSFDSGIRVYNLQGPGLPAYSHTIPFPVGVTPSGARWDELYALGDDLYLSEDADNQWHKIDLNGTLLETYDLQATGEYNFVGSMAIVISVIDEPDMEVRGDGQIIADGDVTPSLDDHTHFGTAAVSSGQVTRTFSIANAGTVPLQLIGASPVTLSGPHAADFTIASQPGLLTLNPGQTTTFGVRFQPGAAGLRSAVIQIASNDPDEHPYDFAIAGTGRSQIVINEVDPGEVDAVELYNAGLAAVDLTGWSLRVTASSSWAATVTLPEFTLGAGQYVVLHETFGTNTGTDLYLNQDIVWVHGGAGSVGLRDAGGTGVDFVRWGGSSEPPPAGTPWSGPNPVAGAPPHTLGRNQSSADTDSGADWTWQPSSLGAANAQPDVTPPSILQRSPAPETTITSTAVHVDVTFSEAVVGVDNSDLVLSAAAAAAAAVGPVVDLGANRWRFPITGLSEGALTVSLAPNPHDIEDLAGNDLANAVWHYTVSLASPSVLFFDDFSTDLGWTGYQPGYWEHGPATAGGGSLYGNPDPGFDHTPTGDNYLIGVNIGGDYPATVNGPHYLTSPVIDCAGQTAVKVSFYRWLNDDGAIYANNHVEVFDGSGWQRVFLSKWRRDNGWQYREYDVSKYAANNANFRVRFMFESTSASTSNQYSGWNIDDFQVSTFSGTPNLFVDPDAEAGSTAWTLVSSGSNLGGERQSTNWASHGDTALRHFTTHNYDITAGSYRGYQQTVDLTNIDRIIFDARYHQGTHVQPRVLIDGAVQWSRSAVGTYLDQELDVSSYSGNHTVRFELYVATSGTSVPSEWVFFDHVRVAASGGPDTTPPSVISRLPAPGSTIAAATANIDVTFSEPVQGVDATDLVVSGTAAAAASVATPVNTGGNTWRFPVSGLDNGTLHVSLAPDAGDIRDLTGNALVNVTWSYTVLIGGSSSEGFETGDLNLFPWTHSGNTAWTVTASDRHSGTYSARSGAITHNQSTSLQITMNTQAGNISFWRRVSSESSYDFLRFSIDDVVQGSWSGEQAWAQQSYAVTAGSHTFTWTYSKDSSLTAGSDAAWIDDIIFPSAVLAAPVMDAEPPTTVGTSNTVYWSAVAGADEYYAEYDNNSDFSSPEGNSGWIADTQHTFSGLTLGVTYYYRVKARDESTGATGTWTQTTQGDFGSGTLTNTSASSVPGDVVLSGGSGDVQDIFVYCYNATPEFIAGIESMGHTVTKSATWPATPSSYDVIVVTGGISNPPTVSNAVIDAYTSGGGGLIVFEDAIKDGVISTTANSNPVSSFNADWVQRTGTTVVDAGSPLTVGLGATSTLSGYTITPALKAGANVAIRWTDGGAYPMAVTYANGSGNIVFFNDFWAYYGTGNNWYGHTSYGHVLMSNAIDYVGTSSSGYAASGSVVSTPIAPNSLDHWGTLTFGKTTPTDTTLTVDVLPATGSTPVSGYSNVTSGTILAGITDTIIRLRANLSTSDPDVTPALHDWTVSWQEPDSYVVSGWSNTMFSQQLLEGSAKPIGIDMLPASDTGVSDSDQITQRNNSGLGKELEFSVSGTVSGATVTIYANGVALGSAVASGATTVVTTAANFALADGSHSITARQTEPGLGESPDSDVLLLTVDTHPPVVSERIPSPGATIAMTSMSVDVAFSELVAGVQAADLVLGGTAGGMVGTSVHLGGEIYRFPLTGLTRGILDLSLAPQLGDITDLAGNPLGHLTWSYQVEPDLSLVDDGDPGFAATGTWTQLVQPGAGFGDDMHWSPPGDGSNVGRWTFPLAPGHYQVAVTWPAAPDRASTARYTLWDDDRELVTQRVDQRLAPNDFSDPVHGGSWEVLDTVTVTGSELVVTLTDAADGVVIADAVRVRRVAPRFGQPPIIGVLSASVSGTGLREELTLTCGGVTDPDGDVVYVTFWHDVNGNGVLDGRDVLLGIDHDDADGWSITVSTAGLPSGELRFLARATDSGGMGWLASDVLNSNAGLGMLEDNGGNTRTHRLLPGSPAIDAGTDLGAPATDQRGILRPQDGGSGVAVVDIGAFERYHGEIHGVRFHDLNGNGVQDPGEPGLGHLWIYLDLNRNGRLDPGEPTTLTLPDDPLTPDVDEAGTYSFTGVPPGSYSVMEVTESGWEETFVHYGLVLQRASLGMTRSEANGTSHSPAFSGDGRYLAFVSEASNLVPGDTNDISDVFLVDLLQGETARVSLAFDRTQGNGSSLLPALSDDGRYVAFESLASNLVPGDTNDRADVFVYDRTLQTIERVSIASDGSQGNDHSRAPSISGDGRYVVFESAATNLVPGDTNQAVDIFVYDRQLSTLQRASQAFQGGSGNGPSGRPVISGDGRWIAFQSSASNLVPDDTNGVPDIFVYDRQTATTERVSLAGDGSQGDDSSSQPAISVDGRYVAFASLASNLVPGGASAGVQDIFVFDRHTHEVQRVNPAFDGVQANGDSSSVAISADGRYVSFESSASNLVPGDDNHSADIFLVDRQLGTLQRISVTATGVQGNSGSYHPTISADGDRLAFFSFASNFVPDNTRTIGDIFVADQADAAIECVSMIWVQTEANGDSYTAATSRDGRFVAFDSNASNLVPDDTNGWIDVFVLDRQTGGVERVSLTANGTQGNEDSRSPSITEDGRYVAFQSRATNLVPGVNNARSQVYVYDRQTGTIECVSSNGQQQGNGDSSAPAISGHGRYVAFRSEASNLVAGDTNGRADIFVYDRLTRAIERVSVADDGAQANHDSWSVSISSNGRYVAFDSAADNLVPGDNNLVADVFVYDRQARTIERVSVRADGLEADGASRSPQLSSDGRHVAFASRAAHLVPHDLNGFEDVFVFDRQTGAVERVSLTLGGGEANGPSSEPTLSADGRYVAFRSEASDLVPGDTNQRPDVFWYDRRTGAVRLMSTAWDGGASNGASGSPMISANGLYVVFNSAASNLVPADLYGKRDIFAAATPAAHQPKSKAILVAPGQKLAGIDWGNQPSRGLIYGRVFHDLDRDGYKDGSEPGLDGWTLYLDLNGNGLLDGLDVWTQTNALGEFSFAGLPPLTTYTVAQVPQAYWLQTAPRPASGGRWNVEVGAGEIVTGIDFGNHYRGPGGQDVDVIRGRLFGDFNGNGRQDAGERGLAGVTVYLDINGNGVLDAGDVQTVTSSDNPATPDVDEAGWYAFEGLGPGKYTVRIVPPAEWTQTTPRDSHLAAVHYGGNALDRTRAVAVGDLNGDGHPDLVVAHGNYVSWLANDGSGSFAAPVPIPAYNGISAWSLVVEDFNGDGHLDLAVGNYLSSNVSVLLNDGHANFALQANYAVGIYPHGLTACDFDRDGNLDLVVALERDDRVAILRNDGTGSFSLDATKPLSGINPFGVVCGQFNDDNNDGRVDHLDAPDLVVANFGNPLGSAAPGSVALLLNNGSGQFPTRITVPAGSNPVSVAVADFDGDGDLDVAVANFGSNDIAVLVNLGNGSFVRLPTFFPAGIGPYALVAADLDGDGRPDLIVTNGTEDRLAVLRNGSRDGVIAFASPQSVGVANFPDSLSFGVVVHDMNDDGILDVVTANGAGNNLSVMLNQIVVGAHRVMLDGLDSPALLEFGLQPPNAAPTISPIPDPAPIYEDAPQQTVTVTGISSGRGPSQPLAVSARSDREDIIPTPTVHYASPDSIAVLTYQPIPNAYGTAVITVTVMDGGPDGDLATDEDNAYASEAFSVVVKPVNDPPTLDAIADLTIAGGSLQQVIQLTGISAGPGESQPLRITAVSENTALIPHPVVGYTSPNPTGALVLAPPLPNQHGTAVIRVTVEDAGLDGNFDTVDDNASFSRLFTVTVTAVNNPPQLDDRTFHVSENATSGTVVGIVQAFDPDFDDTHTYAIAAGNHSGVFAIGAQTGQITVADPAGLDYDSVRQFVLTVQVTDSGGLGDTAAVTIHVLDANRPPQITAQTFHVDENVPHGTVVGMVAASDPDVHDVLTYWSTAGNVGGTFAIGGLTGQLTVNTPPGLDFETRAEYTLTVEVRDRRGLTASAPVTVYVHDLNDPPTLDAIADRAVDKGAGEQLVALTGISDGDDGTQPLAVTAASSNPSLIPHPVVEYTDGGDSGVLRFSPVAGRSGTALITVTVTDGGLDKDLSTAGDNATFSRTFQVVVNDNDVYISPIPDPAPIERNAPQQTLIVTGIASGRGPTQPLLVTARSDREDIIPRPTVHYTSPDSIAVLTYRPATDAYGTAVITVTVMDGGPDGDLATEEDNVFRSESFTVTVTAVNHPPRLDDRTFHVPENAVAGAVVGTMQAFDPDIGDAHTYSITARNDDGAFAIAAQTGQITVGDPAGLDYDSVRQFALTVQVTDSGGLSDTAAVTIHVLDANRPPEIGAQTFYVDENVPHGTVVGTVAASDPDANDVLTYWITAGNVGGAFAIGGLTGQLTVNTPPGLDFETPAQFTLTVQVKDRRGLTASAPVTVHVHDLNDPPTLNAIADRAVDKDPGAQLVGLTGISDGDDGTQPLAVTALSSNPSLIPHPVVEYTDGGDSGVLRFSPAAGRSGTALITVTVTDGGLDKDLSTGEDNAMFSRTFQVVVNDNNVYISPIPDPAPIERNAPQQTLIVTGIASGRGPSQLLAVTARSDREDIIPSPAVSYTSPDSIAVLTYQPLPDASGTVVITVTVMDGGADGDLATEEDNVFRSESFTVTVTAVNHPPRLDDRTFHVPENAAAGAVVGTMQAFDPDVDDAHTYSITAGNDDGAFAIAAQTGQIAAADPAGLDYDSVRQFVLTVQVTDSGGLTDTAAVTIHVLDANRPPQINAQTFQVDENVPHGTVVGTIAASDPDPNDVLTYWLTAGNAGGAFAIGSLTGQLTINTPPGLDFETRAEFTLTVEVRDRRGLTASAPVTVFVNDLNDPPMLDAIADRAVDKDPGEQLVALTGISDGDDGTQPVAVTAASSNPSLIPHPLVEYTDGSDSGLLRFSPAAGRSGTALITVTMTDGGLDKDLSTDEDNAMFSRTFQVVVNDNDVYVSPIADPAVIERNAPPQTVIVTGIVSGRGSSQPLAVTARSDREDIIPTPTVHYTSPDSIAVLTYRPVKDAHGITVITVTVMDGGPDGDLATEEDNVFRSESFTVTVTAVNNPPILEDRTFHVDENVPHGTVVGIASATDADPGDTHIYSIIAGNDMGAFLIAADTGEITVNVPPVVDYEWMAQFALTVRVVDSAGAADYGMITILVRDLNEAPIVAAALADQQAWTNQLFTFTFDADAFQDPDFGDVLTFAAAGASGASLPGWLSFAPATRTLSGTPGTGDAGSFPIAVTARDSGGLEVTDMFLLTVQSTASWQNAGNRFDVDGNGTVAASDVLVLINYINSSGIGPLPEVPTPPPFLDVNGDGRISPNDVIDLINFINANSGSGEGEAPEVRQADDPATAAANSNAALFPLSVFVSASATPHVDAQISSQRIIHRLASDCSAPEDVWRLSDGWGLRRGPEVIQPQRESPGPDIGPYELEDILSEITPEIAKAFGAF